MNTVNEIDPRIQQFAHSFLHGAVLVEDEGLRINMGCTSVRIDTATLPPLASNSEFEQGLLQQIKTGSLALWNYATTLQAVAAGDKKARKKAYQARKDAQGVFELNRVESDRVNRFDRWGEESLSELVSQLATKGEMHFAVHHWNCDEDDELLLPLIRNSELDRGTALYLFWYKGFYEVLEDEENSDSEFWKTSYAVGTELLNNLVADKYVSQLFQCRVPDEDDSARTFPSELYRSVAGEFAFVRETVSGSDTFIDDWSL